MKITENSKENLSSMPNTMLNELLDNVGFVSWLNITNSFVLPSISIVGIIFCSISVRIFFKKQFCHPIFFYYRVLSFVYIFGLMINIPSGVLFSPRYFANIDTYSISVVQIYYSALSYFLFHYGSVLEICMLLTRIKIFSPFVRKRFSGSPSFLSILFFMVCFSIDFPLIFSAKPGLIGEYYFTDTSGQKHRGSLYCLRDSEMLPVELWVLVFSYIISNAFTLIVGVVLNIVLLKKYKAHLNQLKNKEISLLCRTNQNQPREFKTILLNSVMIRQKYKRKMSNNISYMIITLCSISILSRFLKTCWFIYFYFFHAFELSSVILTAKHVVYTFVPTCSIFVFSFFNKIFRSELKNMLVPYLF
jgi:hypothetical protein